MTSTIVERDIYEALIPAKESSGVEPPLVVDLDHTCVKTDLLLEYLLALLRKGPRYLFFLPFWLVKGRSQFTLEIVRRASWMSASFLTGQSSWITSNSSGRKAVLFFSQPGTMRN